MPFAFLAGLLRSRLGRGEEIRTALTAENEQLNAELRGQGGGAARLARAHRRGRRRRAAPDRARPARRRPAAAGRAGDEPAAGPRQARRPTPTAPPSCSTRRSASCARRLASCASSPAASTRRCSPTAAWTRRSAALAARSPGAGRADRRRPATRCPAPVEATAYFVVAEALTNVAKLRRGERAPRCAVERATDGAVVVEVARRRRRRRRPGDRAPACAGCATASPRSTAALTSTSPPGEGTTAASGAPVRVVIAEDSVLLREGVARLLEEAGFEVVGRGRRRRGPAAQGPRPQARRRASSTSGCRPTHTDDGLRAALVIRAELPGRRRARALPVRRGALRRASCSPTTPRASATCSRTASPTSTRFVDAVRRVADGGSVLDPEVVAQHARPRAAATTRSTR